MATDIEQIIGLSILTALAILGFRKAMQPDYILSWFREILEESEHTFILKPVFLCEYCMSSAWTIIVHLIFWDFDLINILFGILVTCGLVVIFNHDN